jgi:hypothetical protein
MPMLRNKRAKFILGLLLFLIVVTFQSITPISATEDSWTTMEPMQQARGGLGVIAVNGKIYAIGGSNQSGLYPPDINGGFVGTTEEYDPETDSWTFKASMPTPRAYFSIAVYENKIYCIGGTVDIGLDDVYHLFSTYINSRVNEVYDTATDTWETKTPLPIARRGLEANVVGGKIYLIGDNRNEMYDPATDTWTTKSPMPSGTFGGFHYYASTVVDGKIYVVYSDNSDLDEESQRRLLVYDAKIDSWSQGTPASSIVIGGKAVATTGKMASKRIYILGVKPGREPPRVNHVYDPKSDSWKAGATVLTNRQDFGAVVINDKLYVVGGYTFDNNPNTGHVTASAVNEQYTPIGYGFPDPSYVPPDTIAPEVSVISPQNETSYKPDLPLNFNVNESVLWMHYKLDGETVEVEGNSTLNGLAAGSHNLTVYATDVGGNTGASETICFTVDNTTPLVSVLTPENTTYDVAEVPLNFTVNEEASRISYSLDGQEPVTINGNATLSGLTDGIHNVTVYAEDMAGNVGTTTATFTVTGPEISLTLIVVASGASLAAIAIALFIYFKKRKKQH